MVKLVILILIGVLALSFFGITIQSIVNSPAGQANFAYLGGLMTGLWTWIVSIITQGVSSLVHLTSWS